jgi:hypothetical protein
MQVPKILVQKLHLGGFVTGQQEQHFSELINSLLFGLNARVTAHATSSSVNNKSKHLLSLIMVV